MSKRFITTQEQLDSINPINKNIVKDYLSECKAQGKKDTTIYQYKRDLYIFSVYVYLHCGNKEITSLVKKDFRDFIIYITNDLEWSNARVNRIMSTIKNLLYFLEDEEDYDYQSNQARKFKSLPKRPVKKIVFVKDKDIMTLYNRLMKDERYMDATLLALAYESSARKTELSQVLKASIKDERNCTNVVTGKRGKKFPLIYFDLTKKACKKYLKQRGEDGNDLLFITKSGKPLTPSTLYSMVVSWRPLLKEITGQDLQINVHSLRHSALQNYSDGTHEVCKSKNIDYVPIDKLKAIARHSDSNITQSYLKSQEEKQLEDLFNITLEYD